MTDRLYTNKAMAIGAVIDAIECDLADLTDIWMMAEGRLREKGVFKDAHPYLSEHDIDRLNDDDEIDDSDWEIVTNCTSEFD